MSHCKAGHREMTPWRSIEMASVSRYHVSIGLKMSLKKKKADAVKFPIFYYLSAS